MEKEESASQTTNEEKKEKLFKLMDEFRQNANLISKDISDDDFGVFAIIYDKDHISGISIGSVRTLYENLAQLAQKDKPVGYAIVMAARSIMND